MSGCSQGEPLSTVKCGPEKVRNRTEDKVPPYLKLSVERGVITLSSTEGPSVWIAPQPSANPAPVAVRNEGPAEDHPASYARSQVQPYMGAGLTLAYPAALGESLSASEIEEVAEASRHPQSGLSRQHQPRVQHWQATLTPALLHNQHLNRPRYRLIIPQCGGWHTFLRDLHTVLTSGVTEAKSQISSICLLPKSVQDFWVCQKFFADFGHAFHTFLLPEERELKIVVSGIPHDTSVLWI